MKGCWYHAEKKKKFRLCKDKATLIFFNAFYEKLNPNDFIKKYNFLYFLVYLVTYINKRDRICDTMIY